MTRPRITSLTDDEWPCVRGIAFGFILGILAWLGVWIFADFCVWLAKVTR